jgi:hypothetical protein
MVLDFTLECVIVQYHRSCEGALGGVLEDVGQIGRSGWLASRPPPSIAVVWVFIYLVYGELGAGAILN